MAENLISRLSLLIANLYQFVLVPALIFITKTFSSPLVFTLQWSVYRETSHSSLSLCFARQNKLISFSFPSSTELSVPYSSSEPCSAPDPVWVVFFPDRIVHSVPGTPASWFETSLFVPGLSPWSYPTIGPDTSPPYGSCRCCQRSLLPRQLPSTRLIPSSYLPALGPHFPAPPQGSATCCRYPSAALLPSFESIMLPQKIPLVLFLLGLLPSLVDFSGHHCLAFSPAPSVGQPTVTEGHSPPQILLCPTQKYTARKSPYELQNAAESPFQNGQIHPLSLPLLPQTGSPFFIFYF